MPHLSDTNILLRFTNVNDPEHEFVRDVVHALLLQGEALYYTQQSRREAFDLVEKKMVGKERWKATESEHWELLQVITDSVSGCRFVIDGFDGDRCRVFRSCSYQLFAALPLFDFVLQLQAMFEALQIG